MSLVAPVFLAALGLLVPVLIAFLVRRPRQVVRVPSTMVWRLGARSVAKSRRIRNARRLLALLACLGGVAALVVAAARPTGGRRDAVVYVVDVSASMSGAPLREARAWLARDVAGRGPNARVAIVLAGAEPRVALSESAPGPRVDEAIRAISAEKAGASMDEAVALAEGMASASDARVVVLTDEALAAEVSRSAAKPEQRVFGRPPAGRDNLGVVGLFTRTPADARDDEEREASITVVTSSTAPRRARLVVTLAGSVVAERHLDLPARGAAIERVGVRGAGRLVARVEPADGRSDALDVDDEASLEEAARRPPRVALIHDGGGGSARYFVEKALRAAGVTEIAEVAGGADAPADAELAVVLRDGDARLPGVPAFLIGVEPKELGLDARVVGRGETHLRSVASEDPLLRGVALDELTALRAKVAAAPRGSRALVELDAGPALIAGGAGTSSWVWLGIDPEASDLVLRVAFPVLVGNVLGHLGGAAQVVAAETAPRAEVMLDPPEVLEALPAASDPRWRLPVAPPIAVAFLGALLLALEAWLTFRRRWAT